MADRVATIREIIAAQPRESHGSTDYLQRVSRAATSTLSASGAGVSVLTEDGVRGVCVASDLHTERIEELQFVLGEGPCIDAFESRRPVLVSDLDDEAVTRWPMYGPAAHADGVRAVFAFPLQLGASRLGVLDVFRDRPGALSTDQLSDALTFADLTVQALLDQQEDADADTDDGPALAVERRAELFQAQGMVMVQIEGTISEAMARMRALAYAENRDLSDITSDVLARKLQFAPDRP